MLVFIINFIFYFFYDDYNLYGVPLGWGMVNALLGRSGDAWSMVNKFRSIMHEIEKIINLTNELVLNC